MWLGGAFVIFAASFGVTTVLNFLPGFVAPLGIVVDLAVSFALWLWAMKALTNRDVGWKALVPGAVLGAVGFEILKAVGSIYVPRLVASSQALYGTLGIVFAISRGCCSSGVCSCTPACSTSCVGRRTTARCRLPRTTPTSSCRRSATACRGGRAGRERRDGTEGRRQRPRAAALSRACA